MATSNITVPAPLWWPDWKQVCWQNWAWCMPCRRSEAGRGTCELVHFWVSQKRCNLHFFWLFKGFLLPNLIVGGCSGWWLWTPKWLQTLCLKKVHLRNVSKLSTGPEEIVKWSWQPGNMVVDSSLRHGSWYSRVLQKIRPGASSWGQIHCQCCCPEEVFKWFPDVYMTLKVDWGVVFPKGQLDEFGWCTCHPPQMPTFPLANRWDSKSWFWGWIANEFSMPNDQRNARQKLPEVRVVLMYVHAREETVYRRAIERGVQGRVVSKVEVHPDSLWMACGDTLVSQNDPKWHKLYFNHPIWTARQNFLLIVYRDFVCNRSLPFLEPIHSECCWLQMVGLFEVFLGCSWIWGALW